MKTSIISDCVKYTNVSGDFIYISNDIPNSTNSINAINSPKLSIDVGNSNFIKPDKFDLSEFTTHKMNTLIIGKKRCR